MQFVQAHIVSRINYSEVTSDSNRILSSSDALQMSLVLAMRLDGLYSPTYLTPMRDIVLSGDTISSNRIAKWEDFERSQPLIRWYAILPEKTDTVYTNTPTKIDPWARIQYREIPIPEWNDKWLVELKSLPSFSDYFPGTIRFKVSVAFGREFVSTPGKESRFVVRGYDYGGLSDEVLRVSVRASTGNRFADNLMIFRNVPFIANAGGWNDYWSDHQTVNWIGGNFGSFIVRAAELGGRPLINYFGKLPMPERNSYKVTDYYSWLATIENGVYCLVGNGKGAEIDRYTFGVGDFIFHKDKFVVLFQDRSPLESEEAGCPNALLDVSDLVITSEKGSLEVKTLSEAIGDSVSLIHWNKRW
ncbi:MAG: hypothetical protein COT43_11265 [Candidatus Marinimicrobia bacterium CG08_land_8_20_14_0_20_45_22]|nr:MAG: hypothetical protein COT43_11265 [Candidatus Marinimicrobia bacterium CG08_land_8_20_14_0_20_45_22]